jgi:outer membrane protein
MTHRLILTVGTSGFALAAFLGVAPALAEQTPTASLAPATPAEQPPAHKDPHFGVRIRALAVVPTAQSHALDSVGNALNLGNFGASTAVIPELDLTYFFNKRFATELILGVTKHTMKFGSTEIGSTWLLPPTLTFQYHMLPDSMIKPYLGLGVNVTLPFSSELNATANGAGFSKISLSPTFGFAAQLGVDIAIPVVPNLYVNLDAKYITLNPTAKITDSTGADHRFDVQLNPFLLGGGIGYRF